MYRSALIATVLWTAATGLASSNEPIKTYVADEAHQAVAVDEHHFYAITNRAIAKFEKKTGKRFGKWQADSQSHIKHLNSGFAIDGKLYCANSNWPKSPLKNTLEVFATKDLNHERTIEFDETASAINWVARRDGAWWIVFAHYGGDVGKTELVKFDDQWRRLGKWHFPNRVLKRFSPFSNSGGTFSGDGKLLVTGHDHAEIYELDVPKEPGVLKYVTTHAAPIAGQGIAWDADKTMWGIVRKRREVVKFRLSTTQQSTNSN